MMYFLGNLTYSLQVSYPQFTISYPQFTVFISAVDLPGNFTHSLLFSCTQLIASLSLSYVFLPHIYWSQILSLLSIPIVCLPGNFTHSLLVFYAQFVVYIYHMPSWRLSSVPVSYTQFIVYISLSIVVHIYIHVNWWLKLAEKNLLLFADKT